MFTMFTEQHSDKSYPCFKSQGDFVGELLFQQGHQLEKANPAITWGPELTGGP